MIIDVGPFQDIRVRQGRPIPQPRPWLEPAGLLQDPLVYELGDVDGISVAHPDNIQGQAVVHAGSSAKGSVISPALAPAEGITPPASRPSKLLKIAP